MGFVFYIQSMEEFEKICKNPWCKGLFRYNETHFIKKEDGTLEHPKTCHKCNSFSNDLSGGVEWNDKTYEEREDECFYPGSSIYSYKYKITQYRQ